MAFPDVPPEWLMDSQPDADDPYWTTMYPAQAGLLVPNPLLSAGWQNLGLFCWSCLCWQDPLEVPTDLDDSEPEEVDIMQGAEQNLADYTRVLLDVFPEHFASRLEKLFLESARANCQLRVGTLCSGSDSVVDVLKAG